MRSLPLILGLAVPMAVSSATLKPQAIAASLHPSFLEQPSTLKQVAPNSLTRKWYRYTAPNRSYTARFPAKPIKQKQKTSSSRGIIEFILVGYSDNKNKRFYGTADSPIPLEPGETFDVEERLNGAIDGASRATGAVVISEKRISKNGYPGKEIIMQGQGDLVIIQRLIVNPKKPTLFQAIVVAEDGNITFPEARAFLDSLNISQK